MLFIKFSITFKGSVTMNKQYDVIIVGAGVAGLYCALNLDRKLKVLVICKRERS